MTGMAIALAGAFPQVTVSISPTSRSTNGAASSETSGFTASEASGFPVSSYTWGIQNTNSGTGTVVSGGATATAQLGVTDAVQGDFNPGNIDFYCDLVIFGRTFRATVNYQYNWN